MSDKSKSKIQKLFVDNHYRKFLLECRDEVAIQFSGFWKNLSKQDQLTWLDSVVQDSKKLGFGNQCLIKDYLNIVCKIGKDFLKDPSVDDNLIRFITDSNFSPYVRTRDANRWIDNSNPKVTPPTLAG
jgi:hypothetical protein